MFPKAAFTLAEVLITLGIIGVVAALTIPNLVSNYKKKAVESKLVKFYSTMQQAIKLSEVENGPIYNWSRFDMDYVEDTEGDFVAYRTTNSMEWYNTYLAHYIKVLKVEELQNDRDGKIALYLQDGGLLLLSGNSWIYYPEAKDYKQMQAVDDFTDRDRSMSGKKYFTFMFFFDNQASAGLGMQPFTESGWTIDTLKNHNQYGCKEEVTDERATCTRLIQLNNWKIPDDYFYKF